eukprot:CAMPEP_0197577076 /NCGR_PEP_ID=MMETSP1326-20131121/1838_1 /TAXON_ID=1155430 /ORGANISM="Genus nov. species nov., Strain RCC2288" /LENGTH=152 /DNA_ID=CAMNT_0043140085 /DNA_START=73 /DNA_END=531 /DNA_ORIENTATION=+
MAAMMTSAAAFVHVRAPRASASSPSGAAGFKAAVRGTPVSLSVTARPVAQRAQSLQVVAGSKMTRPNLDDPSVVQFKVHETDSGSSPMQIALLTRRIESLTGHLIINKKDYACQRGLRMLLGKRTRLMRYLAKEDPAKYSETLAGLGLKDRS